jgi:hypothetical protein
MIYVYYFNIRFITACEFTFEVKHISVHDFSRTQPSTDLSSLLGVYEVSRFSLLVNILSPPATPIENRMQFDTHGQMMSFT